MLINRHNYEAFFLLYVDNELNEPDRVTVEQFVQENADLAEEMEMLKQAVLPVENIAFEQKEILYNQAEGITLNNYEEYFSLSVDKELTQQENKEVEKFVLMHPELQNEFTLLEQTRLQPEAVSFAGKEKLYRKEGKERPVIFLNRMRMSVAAAIIGLAVMTWIFAEKNTNKPANSFVSATEKPIKRLPPIIQQEKPNPAVIAKRIITMQEKMRQNAESFAKTKESVVNIHEPKLKKEAFAVNRIKNKPAQQKSVAVIVEKVAEAPAPDRKKFEETIASARIEKLAVPNVMKEGQADAKFASKTPADQSSSIAAHTVYKEINTEEDDEEKSLYIGSAQINKNKLKGLFKKATSFLGVRNNNNDGERTLKIAGFEIKSK